jgi:hypothetical protein
VIVMDASLEAWIAEMLRKGTFLTRDDAIEFCVGATRAFCEVDHITQEKIKTDQKKALEQPELEMEIPLSFPLKWSRTTDEWLRKVGAPHPPSEAMLRRAGLPLTRPDK